MFKVARVNRVNSAENHGVNFLKTGQWLPCGIALIGNGIADFHIGGRFNVGDEIADVTGV